MAIVKDSELDKRRRVNGAKTALEPFTEQSLALLGTKSPAELITLLKLCCVPSLLDAALLTTEERAAQMRLKIYAIAMSNGRDADTLKAANDWLDREEGKAVQRVQSTHELGLSFFDRRARDLLAGGEIKTIENFSPEEGGEGQV